MNWNLGQLECVFCNAQFNCSIGLSNKETVQIFSFCCHQCSGILSIEIDPTKHTDYKLINADRVKRPEKGFLDLKSVRLHLDFPAVITDSWIPFSPFTIAALMLNKVANIEHYRAVTSELNFYSENILTLKSIFNFHKNGQAKQLYLASNTLLREKFKSVVDVDLDYIKSMTILDNVKTRDLDVIFYKTLLVISEVLTKGENPDHEIKELSSYFKSLSREKLCEFRTYLSGNNHLRSSVATINNIYSDIFSNEEFFRPSIFLSDYSKMPFKGKKSPLLLVGEKVGVILNIYKDLVEVISKQYIVIVGLRNIKRSKNYDVFKNRTVKMRWGAVSANNLAEFSSLDLGVKIKFMEGCLYYHELKLISSRIRNSIAHNNWEYNELTQKVTFRFAKNVDEKTDHKNSQTKTMLEINSEVIGLFRLMHKLNVVNYLFSCYYGHRDFRDED
ncbi:hypothetical protein LCH33_004169 [Pseudomonas amygdali]|uniref:TraO protein n=1 Tax=Pseudomonas amygdali pv. hibisci TaxID=251723 RepID=A0AB34U7T5_PSEA0|nr:hypothetical protein [Pseudomonas amygdali]KPX55140.1 hypothetical protein ALO67_200035 [Pseudomonas amygdali pv. hibisci]RMN59240.1 hypothetical protein ALQ57_03698 [Pseudomonas amygdali pv. hibisci]UBT80740.1 hypothetical protein LCH33_004169 [Pseudomonas amygdali]